MSDKIGLKINADALRALLQENRLSYTDIEELSVPPITAHQLKNFINKGVKASEETLQFVGEYSWLWSQ